MTSHHSDLTASLKSVARPRRGILPESTRTTLDPDNACWSGFNPLCLSERVKNGLRGVLQPPKPSSGSDESLSTLDQLEGTFSPVGSSSSDARIYLAQTPFDAGPSTVVWASPKPAWGQWPCLSFPYCISVLTERDANAVYVMNASGCESESDSESPLPPVYECTLDGVVHLWLIVPSRPSEDGMVQLSEEQMRAAVEFYDRSSLCLNSGSTAANEKAAMDPYDCRREEGEDDAGYHADARDAGAGAVLLSCADGNEVDAVALAVLLLARHHHHHRSRSHSHSHHPRGYERLRRLHAARGCGHGAHACHAVGSYTAYQASRLIDDDPRVSHIWKGLLEWQDVERVQAALLSCVY